MSLSLGLSEAVKSVDSTAINNKLVAPDKIFFFFFHSNLEPNRAR